MEDIVLRCKNISKSFPGVKALDKVQFELRRGEVHALCGENGAGKSTIIKIITGLYTKDEGEIEYNGKPINYRSTTECRRNGISLIPQELHLAETLTVAENIFMTKFPTKYGIVDWKKMREDTRALQKRLGESAMAFEPTTLVKNLSMGQKQLVEIMKAISTDVQIIAFDEPTSSLSDDETEVMFELIRTLTAQGISIIYVSHRLAEIFEICNRISVFKDGAYVGTREIKDTDSGELISMMVGRDIKVLQKSGAEHIGAPVLEIKNLQWGQRVKNVSFELKQGEILGMFGIVGAGRTEIARCIFGMEHMDGGSIVVHGKPVVIKSPKDAVKYKIGFVTEDRRGEGLALVCSVAKNLTMPYFKRLSKGRIISLKKENACAQEMTKTLAIKTPSLETNVANLSGGNQQKIVIAKWLGAESDILIFDEPTRGIDVGAKSEIYKLMDKLAHEGKSIIMISSELPEILSMSDRLLVFRDGEIKKEFCNVRDCTEEEILSYAIKS